MGIRYVKHNEIDKLKWDSCIEKAVNCMVYGMSWYLDIVCDNWDALVSDDYEAVMPLPWKKKLGVKYIYHPFFAQQLGVFYRKIADDQTFEFLAHIPSSFLKHETSLNYLTSAKKLSLNVKTNYILPLNQEYETLFKAFSDNTKRNVKKANKENFILSEDIDVNSFIELKKQNSITRLKPEQYTTMANLVSYLITSKHGVLKGVINENKELIGAACFVYFKSRVTYLLSVSNEEGKNRRAMFWLVNKVIERNANKNLILDFEGSMIKGIARFFRGFGSQKERYFRYKNNKLPFIK